MRIFIITMDDPVQTKSFIKKIIDYRHGDIAGLAIAEGDRLTISKNKSKLEYVISLFLIMGFTSFCKNASITLLHKLAKQLHFLLPDFINDPSLRAIAKCYGIKTWKIKSPNDKDFLDDIRLLDIDIIINQSQNLLKSELLAIPKIGTINRHNALLPRNRGRLTPFWVLYNKEIETGVSIHFVTEELDAGEIIVQKSFRIDKKDNFNSIVEKNYKIAPYAVLEALTKLENGEKDFIKNDQALATYNTTPTLREACRFRWSRMFCKFRN